MGVKAKTTASRDRYSEDNWANSAATTDRAVDTNTNTSSNANSKANTVGNSTENLVDNSATTGSAKTTGVTNSTSRRDDVLRGLTNTRNNTVSDTTGARSATFDSPQGKSVLDALTTRTTGGPDYTGEAGAMYSRLGAGGVDPNVEAIIQASDVEANKNFAGRLAETRAGAYRGGTAANIGKQGQLAADFSAQQAGNNAKTRSDAYANANTLALGAASGLGGLGADRDSSAAALLSLLRGETNVGAARGAETGIVDSNQNNTSNNTGTEGTETNSNTAANTNRNANTVGNNSTDTNTSSNANTSTQTTERLLQTIIEALTGGKSGTKSSVGHEGSASYGTG